MELQLDSKKDLLGITHRELEAFLVSHSLPRFNSKVIFDWIYQKKIWDVELWTNIGKKTKELIKTHFHISLPTIAWIHESKDGTRKYLIEFADKNQVECVLIPGKNRFTLCLSSQVGCAIGCTFCFTATMGLTRNLKTFEMVSQYLLLAKEEEKYSRNISNIVFMGQGEPLNNFEEVRKTCEIFLEPLGMALGQRKITLSTSGLCPQIEKLDQFPPINIAISLHAAFNQKRTTLMPINKVYDLERLFVAIQKIPLKAHRRITYEYLLVKDFNDGEEDILALVKLLEPKKSKVNIIPFNEFPGTHLKRPSLEKVLWFNEQLNNRGLTSTIRATKGDDILAACGQLKSIGKKLNKRTADSGNCGNAKVLPGMASF